MSRIVINNWNLGGLSDGDYQGPANSLVDMTGCDVHGEPGIIKAQRALTRQNVTTGTAKFNALCKKILYDTDGELWFFSGDNTNNGIWLENTPYYTRYTSADTGLANLSGVSDACEFKRFVFYFHTNKIGYWYLGGTGLPTNGDADWDTSLLNVQHPCIVKNDVLYFANGNTIETIEAGATPTVIGDFTGPTTVLTLDDSQEITALGEIGTDLLIAVKENTGGSRIYRWDAVTANLYDSEDFVPEFEIMAFVPADNIVLAVGSSGRIYQYDGYQLRLAKRRYLETDVLSMYLGAVAVWQQRPLIGWSNTGTTDNVGGVYSFGNYSDGYPRILTNEFIPSPGAQTQIDIGAMGTVRSASTELLYLSWQDFSASGDDEFGADLVTTTSARYASASFTTRIIDADRLDIKQGKIYINYKSLPNGTAITLKVSQNEGAFTEITTTTDTVRKYLEADFDFNTASTFQLKVEFTISGQNTPEIESIFIDY